jgi:hypothetical protein
VPRRGLSAMTNGSPASASSLNRSARPRKTLGYMTPSEKLAEFLRTPVEAASLLIRNSRQVVVRTCPSSGQVYIGMGEIA